ncbi:MAG: cytochrome c [Hyphomicrobiaceae bacterium]|nr:cytochrome c [Hyphomicrobiaceae bacterium]
MMRTLAAVSIVAISATAVLAQNLDAIKERRQAMRTIGSVGTSNFKMMKGDAPFDLATFQKNIAAMQAAGTKFKDLFPDNAKTGGGTDAAPKIWEQKAQFNAALDAWLADVKAAGETIKDEAGMKANYPKVAQGCGGCHKSADGFTVSLGESFKKPAP